MDNRITPHRFMVGGLDVGDPPYAFDQDTGMMINIAGCVYRLNEYENRVRELQETIEQLKRSFAELACSKIVRYSVTEEVQP